MIYVHIPFCHSKCYYCGFYSLASLARKEAFLDALRKETQLRSGYLEGLEHDSLYFGGGTPSILQATELESILTHLERFYKLSPDAERTIEINPDDININIGVNKSTHRSTTESVDIGVDKGIHKSAEAKHTLSLSCLREMGFNRLSIGVQSFNDAVLKTINRTHTAEQALNAVKLAADLGFDNISIDLLIGLPNYTVTELERDIHIALSLPVSHISFYMLSIEQGSVFAKKQEKGSFQTADDDLLADCYLKCSAILSDNGFEHYEISNFAKDNKYSRQNTGYWQQKSYIGFGPSAHSYRQTERQWNIANVNTYIESIEQGKLPFEQEYLTERELYNEYIMTSLRTIWGADLRLLNGRFAQFWAKNTQYMDEMLNKGLAQIQNSKIVLNTKGWLISDILFSELFAD
ncbi:coproporphyrinogen III oxidase [Bacteroidia bacterium]|nr:coproporphyrinogen III oxidase [Bacteroidia bacterium]